VNSLGTKFTRFTLTRLIARLAKRAGSRG